MVKQEQIIRRKLKCNYCGWAWMTSYNPKSCPRCCNVWNAKPKRKKFTEENA